MRSKTGAHQHHVPSTANNNEHLTNDESSNQEGSDSQEIVELKWWNVISFVCDLQLFELFTYTFIFKTKMLWRVIQYIFENKMLWKEVSTYYWKQNVLTRAHGLYYILTKYSVTVKLYCSLYKISCGWYIFQTPPPFSILNFGGIPQFLISPPKQVFVNTSL